MTGQNNRKEDNEIHWNKILYGHAQCTYAQEINNNKQFYEEIY
jgi:hypothetical protein